jgi:cytochrome c-type biogenesis protein
MAGIGQLGFSLAAGSLTTLSPCVFPILPLVIGGAVQANRLTPLAMGAGMAVSFGLIGMALGLLGPALGIDGDTVRVAGAVLLIVFGVVMLVPALSARFTQLATPLATSANNASSKLKPDSLWSALLLGGLLGLVWSPCSGPLLASALTLVASEGGAAQGGLILGVFGLGAAIPLVVVAYASRSGFSVMRGWVMARIDAIKKAFGVLLLLLGVAILTGGDKWLEAQIVSLLPDWWIDLTVKL